MQKKLLETQNKVLAPHPVNCPSENAQNKFDIPLA